jgi:hypothetical protein
MVKQRYYLPDIAWLRTAPRPLADGFLWGVANAGFQVEGLQRAGRAGERLGIGLRVPTLGRVDPITALQRTPRTWTVTPGGGLSG